jgi:hypothetical protein
MTVDKYSDNRVGLRYNMNACYNVLIMVNGIRGY